MNDGLNKDRYFGYILQIMNVFDMMMIHKFMNNIVMLVIMNVLGIKLFSLTLVTFLKRKLG